MSTIHPVYTIIEGVVTPDAKVTTITLYGKTLPAIIVGKPTSQDSKQSYITVSLTGHSSAISKWKNRKKVSLPMASIEVNKHGKTYLKYQKINHFLEYTGAIIVFRSKFPNGINTRYFGDIKHEQDGKIFHEKFPGKILTDGIVSGKSRGQVDHRRQYIALIPINTVFCTKYIGGKHDGTSVHYYSIDKDGSIQVWTEEDRLANSGMHPL